MPPEKRGGGPGSASAPPAGRAADELAVSRVFSLEAMPYLADHCVMPQPAGWPDMSDRFPIVPLATLLEVMAATARELLPDTVAVGFENVRAVRWVVASPPTTADIRAHLLDGRAGPRRVKVVIPGHADGTVLLADRLSQTDQTSSGQQHPNGHKALPLPPRQRTTRRQVTRRRPLHGPQIVRFGEMLCG